MQENKRTLAESFPGAYDGRLRLLAEDILVSRLEACRETALLPKAFSADRSVLNCR